jgi:hypothetical protein
VDESVYKMKALERRIDLSESRADQNANSAGDEQSGQVGVSRA